METKSIVSRYKLIHNVRDLGLLNLSVSRIFVAPGNGGTAQGLDKVSNIAIAVEDFAKLVDFANKMEVNFVLPGWWFQDPHHSPVSI